MDTNRRQRRGSAWLAEAVITLGTLTLTFAAFDDITTDNDTSFAFEYAVLAVCAAWLLWLSVRLLRQGRVSLGGISLLALASATWGQRAIGPGTVASAEVHYLAMVIPFAWFVVLSLTLLALGCRDAVVRSPQEAG